MSFSSSPSPFQSFSSSSGSGSNKTESGTSNLPLNIPKPRRGVKGGQQHTRLLAVGDDDLLAGAGALQQFFELGLGLFEGDGRHGRKVAPRGLKINGLP